MIKQTTNDSIARLRAILSTGLEKLDLTLSNAQIEQLLHYTQELEKWNKTYNLTAIRDVEAMLKRHVLDALSVVNPIGKYQPKTLADIGTGGGIPGIILAIAFPELQVYLIESIGKKCRFLRHITNALGISRRVQVIQQRVEQWQPNDYLDIIICRAFTSLDNFANITQHLGNQDSIWLAMKADKTENEVSQLTDDFILQNDMILTVPFETAERHLLVLHKKGI